MGYLVQTTRSKIFNEFSLENRKKFFSIKTDKVVHAIDTLYFSVSLVNDLKNLTDVNIKKFIDILNTFKNVDKTDVTDFWYDFDLELLYRDVSFGFYKHCISRKNLFDIFICNTLPNDSTPRLIVQIRSNMLWSFGERYSIDYILNILRMIFLDYNLEIKDIKENRIDYCYHTNSIQSSEKYFSDDYIKNNLDTMFQIGSKVFRKDKKNLCVEYLSLGNRKSNNIFFRSYNKTLEVVEMAYKDFFFDIWLSLGLISNYDHYVLSYCYKYQSFNKRYEAMIRFYLEYGNDDYIKSNCNFLINNENSTLDDYRNFIKGICPEVTRIQNFEFQTMRKFYSNGSDIIDSLPLLYECDPLVFRLFQILDNRKIFLEYLTSKTVNFNSRFWNLIKSVKLDSTIQINYKRKYSNNRNIDLVLNKLKNNLATYSIYKGNDNTDILTDMCNLINSLNDNDIKEYERYLVVKNKKAKAQKSINTLKTLADIDK